MNKSFTVDSNDVDDDDSTLITSFFTTEKQTSYHVDYRVLKRKTQKTFTVAKKELWNHHKTRFLQLGGGSQIFLLLF